MSGDAEIAGYQILGKIGQGGYGTVFQAREERLDRVVALKVLSDTIDHRTIKRFQRECRLTGRLTGHPNVVTVLDTGTTRSGRPYISMGLFEKGSLHDRLTTEGPLPVADVLRTGVKIAGALAAVHDAGVIHGDVKPQNILVSRFGEPALADFGVARMVDLTEVSMNTHAVTPAHAAPELLNGMPHDSLTDVYGLGSTLYQLLSGRAPFHADTSAGIAQLVLKVMTEAPPAIARDDLPAPVFEAICQAMGKRPEDRFTGPTAFAQRLQQLQAQFGMGVTDLITVDQGATPSSTPIPPWAFQDATTDPPVTDSPTFPRAPEMLTPPATPVAARATMPPPGPARRSRPAIPLVVGISALVAVGAIVAVAALFLLTRPGPAETPPPQATGPPTAAASPSQAGPVDPGTVAAARPRNLRAKDSGSSVRLRWELPEGARRLALTVQADPDIPGQNKLIPVETQGATETTIVGIEPDEKYCFRVIALVALGSPPTLAKSEPACIRGATSRFAD